MKSNDILADQMKIGGPVPVIGGSRAGFWITERRDIIHQRVQPDIHNVLFVARHRHAPGKARSADRQVAQAAFNETDDFIPTACGCDEVGIGFVKREQRLSIGGQPKEIARLLYPGDLSARGREFLPVRPVL